MNLLNKLTTYAYRNFFLTNILLPNILLVLLISLFEVLTLITNNYMYRACIYVYAFVILTLYIATNLEQVAKASHNDNIAMRSRWNIVISCFSSILFFAILYSYLYYTDSSSFSGYIGESLLSQLISFIYFSFAIFLTVGFGDIAALSPIARILVTIEMIYAFSVVILILSSFESLSSRLKKTKIFKIED